MRKTSIGIVVGILAITALILMSGIALANSTTNNSMNDSMNNSTMPTATGTVAATVTTTATTTATDIIEETDVPTPKKTDQKVAPEKTIKPGPTKSPGFGSIMAIVTMLSAIYIFRTKRK